MEKFILADTNEEVNIGDLIKCTGKKVTENSYCTYKEVFTLTKESLQELINEGVIIVKEDTTEVPTEKPFNLESVTSHLANRLGLEFEDLYETLDQVGIINKAALFSILLKECALILDEKYPDHISNSQEIFIVSTFDGKISKVPRHHIKTFKHFAAFRTLEDARAACRVLRPWIKEMFRDAKQKD